MSGDWEPQDGERCIYLNRNIITCQRRVLNESTGQRCILVGAGSHLKGQLVPFDHCRPYWQPDIGQRVRIVAEWCQFYNLTGEVVKTKFERAPPLSPGDPEQLMPLYLVRIGDNWLSAQVPWLMPTQPAPNYVFTLAPYHARG